MRVRTVAVRWFGIAGILVATAVHGQVAPSGDPALSRWQPVGSNRAATYDGMLLADGSDSFGASRKAQGSNFYAGGVPSGSSTRNTDAPAYVDGSATAANVSGAAGDGSASGNSNPQSDGNSQRRGMNAATSDGMQSIFPGASGMSSNKPAAPSRVSNPQSGPTYSANSQNSMGSSAGASFGPPQAAMNEGNATVPADNNPGLKTLQQRLAAMRKASPDGGSAAASDLPSAGLDAGGGSTQLPTPTAAAPFSPLTIQSVKSSGQQNGPATPKMPELRIGQRAPLSADASEETDSSSLPASSPATTNSATPSAPVVGGPIDFARKSAVSQPPVTVASPNSNMPEVGEMPAPPLVTSVASRVSTNSGASSAGLGSSARLSSSPTSQNERPVVAAARPTAGAADNVLFARQSPLMQVETTGPRSITVGKEATYTVAITNAGEFAAQDVAVSIKTPDWTEVVSAKGSSGAGVVPQQRGEPVIWRLPRLEPCLKEQLVLRLVPRESRPFDLSVQWTCSPVASQAVVDVKEPKLQMSLDGPSEVMYGQTKMYRLTIANPGSGDAENVVLVLAPVDGGGGPPTRHEVGLIRAGENKPVEMELAARHAGMLSIKAVVVAEGNLRAEVNEEILVRRAGLKSTISGPEMKFAGTPGTYSVLVSNNGNATAKNLSVAAILPAGAKYVSSSGGQYVEGEHKVVWSLPSLRPGTDQELELRCALNTPGINQLQVLATAASDLADSCIATTNVEALADLKLEVIDPPGPLASGEEMTYEVHIRNRGSKEAESVDVAGFFSQGMEPVSAQGGPSEISPGQVLFKPIASIAAGGEAVLKIKARAEHAGTHIFRVEVNCRSMGAKLASEETTTFYGEGPAPVRMAARPSGPSGVQPTGPSADAPPAPPMMR